MPAGLIDRSSEIAAFHTLLTAGVAAARTLVVSGEPGIGKTRLLTEFAQRAAARGMRVVSGQASVHAQEVPFAAMAEVITTLLGPAPGQRALPDVIRRDLLTMLASASLSGRGWFEGCAAMRTALDLTAGRGGLVVVLDNLHWADRASVELLGYLLSHPCSDRVVLLMAYRPRQVPGALATAVTAAVDAGRARQLEVGPLSVDAVRSVLGPAAPRRLVRQLHAESGGNPRYLMALAKGIGSARSGPRPMDLDAALRVDLEALSPTAVTVARAAAVLGTTFEADALAPVAELPTGAVAAALDELTHADLVRPDSAPGALRFRHALLGHAVYQRAGSGWRRAAHARAAVLYARQATPPEDWAHHVEQSAPAGDESAVALLMRAGEALRFRAPATAARWFGSAARLLPDRDDAHPRRGALLLARAETLAMAGELRQSWSVTGEALAMLTPRSDKYPRVVRHAAQVAQLLGQPQEAAALLRRGLRDVAHHQAPLWLELAGVEVTRGRFGAARDALRRAMAGAGADAADLALTGGIQAATAYFSADTATAVTAADDLGRLIDGMADPELTRCLRSVVWLSWANLMLGRYIDVARRHDRAVELARVSGQLQVLAPLLAGQGYALRWLGRLDHARDCFIEAADIARSTGAALQLTIALTGCCHLASLTGEPVRPTGLTEELRASAAHIGGWFATQAEVVLAVYLARYGSTEQTTTVIIDAAGGPGLPNVEAGLRAECYELLTRTALRAGNQPAASQWASRATAATAVPLPIAAGFAALAHSQARIAAGDAAGAAQQARDAVTTFERAGTPLEAGRAQLLAGQALGAAGRRDDAQLHLDRAREHVAATGAHSLRQEIARELRRLSLRLPLCPASGTVAGPALETLSPREREIAELVTQGCTNRAIASTLFLSVKTVERHLCRIFTKLNISSRAGLAALIASHAAVSVA